ITDYKFVEVIGNETGKYVEGKTEVTYYYEKDQIEIEIPDDETPLGPMKQGDLVVKYLEKGTDKELSVQEDTKNPVGTDYTTIKKNITDYKFVEVKGNETGKYVEGKTEIIYYYMKAQKPVVEIPIDSTEIEIPEEPIPLGKAKTDEVEIPDDSVPLGQAKINEPNANKLPKTGSGIDTSNLIMIGLMLTMLGGIILAKKKK
ncbi:MucBP domain-containing protein, partial [Clostridium gasigenes]|uniref:MucBP domain-containing protein n=1 Tax=Clostridium gasigenes TaxID=94869 RepID=UPI001C0BFD11